MLPEFDITEAPPERIAALLLQIAARLMAAAPAPARDSTSDDRLLTVDEAAVKLGVTPEWLYKRAKALGAVKLDRGTLRFSAAALDDYIAKQTLAVAPTRRRRA